MVIGFWHLQQEPVAGSGAGLLSKDFPHAPVSFLGLLQGLVEGSHSPAQYYSRLI